MPDSYSVELEDEISLRRIFAAVWAMRWTVLSVTVLTTLAAGGAAVVVDKKYTASVVVAAVANTPANGTIGSISSQFGGLAALAGVSVQGDSKKSESLAVLQSAALTEDYIRENNLLPILYSQQWDTIGKKWKTEPGKTPTLWTANQLFKTKVRSLVIDTKTGLVTLTVVWKNAELAAAWANDLVRKTNNYLRSQAIQESDRNIAYLTTQAAKTETLAIKQSLYELLQNEISKGMLARGSEEYALKVLDPAIAPESPSSPKLTLWLVTGFMAGLFTGILAVYTRGLMHKSVSKH